MTNTAQNRVLTGSNILLSDGSVVDISRITAGNYAPYQDNLSTAEQARVDAIAEFVENFETAVEINPTQVAAMRARAMEGVTEMRRLLTVGGPRAVRESMDESVRFMLQITGMNEQLNQIELEGGVFDAARLGVIAGDAVDSVFDGAGSGVQLLRNSPGIITTYASLFGDILDGRPSEAQSQAFATAYVLAEREASRRSELEGRDPGVIDKALSGAQAFFMQFEFIERIVETISNGFDWNAAAITVAERRAERETNLGGNSFDHLYSNYIEAATATRDTRELPNITHGIVTSASEVAGITTAPIAGLLRNGGSFIDQSNKLQVVQPIAANPELTTQEVINPETGQAYTGFDLAASDTNIQGTLRPLYADQNGDFSVVRTTASGATAIAGGYATYRGGAATVRGAIAGVNDIGSAASTTRRGHALRGAIGVASGEATEAAVERAGGRVLGALTRVGSFGARRAIPAVGVAYSGYEAVSDIAIGLDEGNYERVASGATTVATVAGGAALGAKLGAIGFTLGPVGFATTAGGALLGASIAGLADMGRRAFWDGQRDDAPQAPVSSGSNAPQTLDPREAARREAAARSQASGVSLDASGGETTTGPASAPFVPAAPQGLQFATV